MADDDKFNWEDGDIEFSKPKKPKLEPPKPIKKPEPKKPDDKNPKK